MSWYRIVEAVPKSDLGKIHLRLSAKQWLVEVEPCGHGNYAPHEVPLISYPEHGHVIQCDGKPKEDT